MRTPQEIQARYLEGIKVSATQIDTIDRCQRLHHLKKVCGIPEQPQPVNNFSFGTVLHGVLERFLKADARGANPDTGSPVNLYPDGWDYDEQQDCTMTPRESALIKQLVTKAIEEAQIVRYPLAEIETEFSLPVTDKATMIGFIDWMWPGNIRDHKSSGNPQYCLSKKRTTKKWVGDNLQLLSYAKYYIEEAKKKGEPLGPTISLGHCYYGKKPHPSNKNPWIKEVKDDVPISYVEEKWNEKIVPLVQSIEENWQITDPLQISMDGNSKGACEKYGGCSFAAICHGGESPAHYEKRVNKLLKMRRPSGKVSTSNSTDPQSKGKKEVGKTGFLGGLANRKASRISAVETVGKPASVRAETPETIDIASDGSAPWYKDGCKACSKNNVPGFNSKGDPCKICNSNKARENMPAVFEENFDWTINDDTGECAWALRADSPVRCDPDTGTTDSITGGEAQSMTKAADDIPAEPEESNDADEMVAAIEELLPKYNEDEEVSEYSTKRAKALKRLSKLDMDDPDDKEDIEEYGDMLNDAEEALFSRLIILETKATEEEEAEARATANAEGAPIITDDEAEEAEETPKKRGRKKAGVRVLRGVMPTKGITSKTVHLSEVYAEATALVAKGAKEEFIKINAFTRRDMLVALAPQICEALNGSYLIVPVHLSPDQIPLVEAIEGIATEIFVGFAV